MIRRQPTKTIRLMCALTVTCCAVTVALLVSAGGQTPAQAQAEAVVRPYVVVDTGQTACTDDRGRPLAPRPGQPFYGQDAPYEGPQPAYRDNGDGTVSDLNTGLMWVRAPGTKVTWQDAYDGAAAGRGGGRGHAAGSHSSRRIAGWLPVVGRKGRPVGRMFLIGACLHGSGGCVQR